MTPPPLKIDIHTHVLPRSLPRWKERFGYGGFIGLEAAEQGCMRMVRDDGQVFRSVGPNCFDAEVRLADCDREGVRVQVLCTVPTMFSYWAKGEHGLELSQYLNDHLAGLVAAHPRRFVGLGTVPLQAPELAVRELERCVKELGLSGVQIGSHVNAWNLSAPELFPFFAAAERLGAAIFVHPWDMMGEERMGKYWLPWLVGMPAEASLAICSLLFGGVLERLPRLRIAIAHGGGAFPGTLGRIQHGFEVRPDLTAVDCKTPPQEQLGRFFVDSLVHDPDMLALCVKRFGVNRVALGTDYPFPLGEEHPGEVIDAVGSFDVETRARLLGLNALEWLGLPAERFAS